MTILNLLLRNYLHYNLVEQADKLQAKTVLEDTTSSNQLARFRYYQGRIKGIQLDYTGAYGDLQEALRKAPQDTARRFRLTVIIFLNVWNQNDRLLVGTKARLYCTVADG